MTQLVGTNEAAAYVRNMPRQSPSTGMEYPSHTNNRGGSHAGRERHADGDMVGGIRNNVMRQNGGITDAGCA